jgi:hypothetical protein
MNLDHVKKMDQIDRRVIPTNKDDSPNFLLLSKSKQPLNTSKKRVFVDMEDGSKVVLEYKNSNEEESKTPKELIYDVVVSDKQSLSEAEEVAIPEPIPPTPVEVLPVEEKVIPIVEEVAPTIILLEPDKVMVPLGETGSNCFDECESKDALMTPPKDEKEYPVKDQKEYTVITPMKEKEYPESEISVVENI